MVKPFLCVVLLILPAAVQAEVIDFPATIAMDVTVTGHVVGPAGEEYDIDEMFHLAGHGDAHASSIDSPEFGSFQTFRSVTYSATNHEGVFASGGVATDQEIGLPFAMVTASMFLETPSWTLNWAIHWPGGGGVGEVNEGGTYFAGQSLGVPAELWEFSGGTLTGSLFFEGVASREVPEPDGAAVGLMGAVFIVAAAGCARGRWS